MLILKFSILSNSALALKKFLIHYSLETFVFYLTVLIVSIEKIMSNNNNKPVQAKQQPKIPIIKSAESSSSEHSFTKKTSSSSGSGSERSSSPRDSSIITGIDKSLNNRQIDSFEIPQDCKTVNVSHTSLVDSKNKNITVTSEIQFIGESNLISPNNSQTIDSAFAQRVQAINNYQSNPQNSLKIESLGDLFTLQYCIDQKLILFSNINSLEIGIDKTGTIYNDDGTIKQEYQTEEEELITEFLNFLSGNKINAYIQDGNNYTFNTNANNTLTTNQKTATDSFISFHFSLEGALSFVAILLFIFLLYRS